MTYSKTAVFPAGPLLAAAGLPPSCAIRPLAERLDVTTRTAQRWLHGGLTVWEADRAATLTGHHPSAVWADWWTLTQGDAA